MEKRFNLPLLAVAVVGVLIGIPVALLVGGIWGIAKMTTPDPL